ncbi:MAG: sodium-translocating pyrophosphatase [Candidatus Micrarchaeota archaeon]|nr:sodium-translocating pyrophosphatase [Candidatus Micrarchaeota archaeon]MDE1847412.1 sodium-translocating pyrophosphatase [Candidatus Micrarchaeota archaeon]MDE1864093.1 sodium-translocating pyrophosphatase [Candidatus Micrarchaeota archaeon]
MQFYDYSLIAGIISLLFAGYAAYATLRKPEGNAKMKEIAQAIRQGATAYLNRQLLTILAFGIVLAVLFYFFLGNGSGLVVAFVTGAVASYLTAYLGMNVAVRANIRTAQAATKNLDHAFRTALFGGAVTGFAAVGFGLIGISILIMLFTTLNIPLLIGFGFGASLVSLFARVGGGIYTKAADVGADLVGKTELNLPEDDPRNPAVIADNVGDNVGDCAGMAADVFESYAVTLVAALLIAFGFAASAGISGYSYPLMVASLGIIASIISIFFMKVKGNNVTRALYKGIAGAVVIAAILDYIMTVTTGMPASYFVSVLSGLVIAFLLFAVTDYYTGNNAKAVIKVANAARSGAGTDVISGLAVGLRSTWVPAVLVVVAILISYTEAGVYGIGIAAVGMLSLTATILTIDSFGPITDNAGGIAEMSALPHAVRKITDKLDAIGNMTKATTKGFAIGGAALSATALFVAFAQAVHLQTIDALNPYVVVGIFIGTLLPFIFSSFLMESVGYTAGLMVEEVRRQVKTIKGLMSGKAKPDYAKAVDIATVNALKSLIIPEMVAILTPIVVGLVLGTEALGGLLVGMIPASFMLALFMSNSGAAMDNAKKYIEEGNFGGKGSDAHKASVVGDTVGDPLKDTAGPSLNSMIKVVSTISILLASIFLAYALI